MFALDIWSASSLIATFFMYLAVLISVGTVLYLWLFGAEGKVTRDQLVKLAVIAALFGLVFTGLRVFLQAGRLLDDGMMGAFDPDMLALTMEGPLGFASFLRGAGLVLLCAVISRRLVGQIIAGIGALLALASFGFVGHATTSDGPWLGLLVTGHLLGLAFWLGALWPLYQEAGAENSLVSAARIAERFGKIASFIVPALILFGGIFAYQIVGDFQTLFTSSYGQTLLVKLGLVAAVLGFAALNKWHIVLQMQAGKPKAGQHLQRSIMLESLIILAVLTVTTVLTTVTSLPMAQGH